MSKRGMLFAILLSLAMIATFLPVSTFADSGPSSDYDLWVTTERDLLPGWDGEIEDHVYGEYRDASHPDGESFESEVTKVEMISGQNLVEWDGKLCYRAKDPEENLLGTAKFKVWYEFNGASKWFTYTVNISKDVYELWTDTDGRSQGLPGHEFDIYADGSHEYLNKDNDYDESKNGLTFKWELTEGKTYATLSTTGDHATLKFKSVAELGSAFHEGLDEKVVVKVSMYKGSKLVKEELCEFWDKDDFYEVYPCEIENPPFGESISFTPEVRKYNVDETDYQVIPIDKLKCDYDDSILNVTESKGTLTVKRLQPWRCNLGVIAIINGGDSVERVYGLETNDCDIWEEEHDIDFYTDADPVPSGVINMENLGDNPAAKFDIRYTVGEWDESGGDEGTWHKKYAAKDYTVTYSDGKASVKLNESLVRSMDDWNDVRVLASVYLKGTDERISETDLWFHIRPAVIDYELPEDTDMLPGWDGWIENNIHLYVENSTYPEGKDFDLNVTNAEIVNQQPDKPGEDVLTLQKEDNGWRYFANNYGSAKIKISFTDYDGSLKTHEFQVNVSSAVYNVDMWPEAGYYNGLPGTSITMRADATKEFVVVSEDDPNEWWHDNTRDGLNYNWSIAEGSEYATLTVDAKDPTKAVVKFKGMPAGWDHIGELVLVKVSITDQNDDPSVERIAREEDLWVEDELFQIYPAKINGDLDIGESLSITPEVRHYKVGKSGYDVVKKVTFGFGNVDDECIKVTQKKDKITVKRLKEWGTEFRITAEFKYGGEDQWRDQWYHLNDISDLSKMKVSVSTKTVKYSKLKKSAVTVAPLTVKNEAGKVTYAGKGTTAKAKKALSINKKTGKIKVKKGTKKGTYKMKVTVRDSGSEEFEPKSVIKTVTIKVK